MYLCAVIGRRCCANTSSTSRCSCAVLACGTAAAPGPQLLRDRSAARATTALPGPPHQTCPGLLSLGHIPCAGRHWVLSCAAAALVARSVVSPGHNSNKYQQMSVRRCGSSTGPEDSGAHEVCFSRTPSSLQCSVRLCGMFWGQGLAWLLPGGQHQSAGAYEGFRTPEPGRLQDQAAVGHGQSPAPGI